MTAPQGAGSVGSVDSVGNVSTALAAPSTGEQSWQRGADVAVVGSGVAGLAAALGASRAGRQVLLLTKGELGDGSTCWAQGGIAAALAPGDTPDRHVRDTLEAGGSLCDAEAVTALATRGPQAVRELAGLGAAFDTAGAGRGSDDAQAGYMFTREGGHSVPRIVHAGGDATGREVQRALQQAVLAAPGVEIVEGAFVLDLLRDRSGAATGLTVGLLEGDGVRSVGSVSARAVVLASGGLGQLYATTSNPAVATGDGLALALRAGAEIVDLEFVQFHPTVLFAGHEPGEPAYGQRPLISEALRGEGATLVDAKGARVMAGVHPLEDLAPRDVVTRGIARRMAAAPGSVDDHVYLDATTLGAELLERRFPTITGACRAAGVEPTREPIPVAPAAHYSCGGIRVDLAGHTSLPGLYAVGEVACSGVHGANRLASNSLLEGLVMGDLLAKELDGQGQLAPAFSAVSDTSGGAGPGRQRATLLPARARGEVAATMARHAGVLRDAAGLEQAACCLDDLVRDTAPPARPSRASWEATNLHAIARVLVNAARFREESRGCHTRTDYPGADAGWERHLISWLDRDGRVRHRATTGTRLEAADRVA